MKSFVRILIVWLALLAVPFAGFASAATSCCPPGGQHAMQHAPAAMQHHDSGHLCDQHHSGAHDGAQDHAPLHDSQHTQHDGKCANCAACCTPAMLMPLAFAPPALPHPPASHAIAFDAGHVPSVDPDHPERPPRFARA